jgi:pimeloyl-ACP methyl ester carboxylesterase
LNFAPVYLYDLVMQNHIKKLLFTTSLLTFAFGAFAKVQEQMNLGANTKAGKYIDIDDIKVYYETYGKGEPLLLLHGNGGSMSGFMRQIPELSKHYKVIAVDSRSHGRTSDSSKELTFTLMASDMSELIKKLNLGSVHVLGQSDGGIIGLELALAHPEQVKKLMTFGANYTSKGWEAKPDDIEMSENDSLLKYMHTFYVKVLKNRPKATDALKKKYKDLDDKYPNLTRDQLKTINTPVLIASGDHDLISLEHTVDLFTHLPHAQLFVVPGATHSVLMEQPELINAAILKFMKTPFRDLDRSYMDKLRKKLT